MNDSNKGKWFTAFWGVDWNNSPERVFFKFDRFVEEEEAIYCSETIMHKRYDETGDSFGMEELGDIEEISPEKAREYIWGFHEKERFNRYNPDFKLTDDFKDGVAYVLATDGYKVKHDRFDSESLTDLMSDDDEDDSSASLIQKVKPII